MSTATSQSSPSVVKSADAGVHTSSDPGEVSLAGQDGAERRLDTAHLGAIAPLGLSTRDAALPMEDGAAADARLRMDGPHEDELLLQAGQITSHLRSHLGELDRREQFLSSQIAMLDDERRQMRGWMQQFEVDMLQRAARFKAREDELAAKISRSERLVKELEAQSADLTEARQELTQQRKHLRQIVEAEFETERRELQQSRDALEESRRALAAQAEQNQREHETAIQESRRQLELEWSRLHARVAEDFENDRAQFELDRAAWTAQRESETQRMARERESLDREMREAEADLLSRRRALVAELDRLKAEHDARLNSERKAFIEDRDRSRLQLQQERAVFENRMRFQQESLIKAREEFESARQEFRHERQQARIEQEAREGLIQRRRLQLDRARSLLDEREQSMEREQELLARSRRSVESELDRDRNRLRIERESWSQERQSQRSELRRQQEALALHAENLEARKARLDHLRNELEETHRSTLEMRMAVEEAWAQLCQTAGADAARKRVEEARRAFADFCRQLHETLAVHRAEFLESRGAFDKQRDEFASERQTVASWMAERDESLRLWEAQLRQEADRLELRDAAWRAARDRWNQEKIGAEIIIRDLLRQLTQSNDAEASAVSRQAGTAESSQWLDEMLRPIPEPNFASRSSIAISREPPSEESEPYPGAN